MLLAPTHASNAPTAAFGIRDVVPPSRLFEIARSRFEAASAMLAIGAPEGVPSALHTVLAIQQAEGAIGSLQSVVVPSTPFSLRGRAATAMDHARIGLQLLNSYHLKVLALGSAALRRETLPTPTLVVLESARERLRLAAATLNPA